MQLTRRLFGGLVAASAMWAALPAIGQEFDGVTLVHFTQGGAADRIAGYKALAEDFTAETGAKIQIVEQPWEQMQTSIINDALSGVGNFDVLDIDSGWDGNVSAWLEPLDDRIARDGFDIGDYQGLNALIAAPEGVRYGIPFTARSMVMFYRQDLLDEAGISVPQTWEELIEASKALTGDGFYGYVSAGVAIQQEKMFFGAFKGSTGRSLFSEHGEPQFNNEQGANAIRLLAELYKSAPPGVFAMDIPEVDQVFLNGEAAFLIEWPDYIQPSLNDPERSKVVGKWGAANPPGPGNYASWYTAINSASKNKDAAWAWLKHISSAEASKTLMVDHGIYATRSSVLLDPEIAASLPGMEAVVDSAALSFSPNWIGAPWGLEWFIKSADMVAAGVTGQTTPEETVAAMAELWNELKKDGEVPEGFSFADLSVN
ncbi:MAG: sugar ABC transporter substrate-binding protein [Rhizobiaceae bacterium]|nr:sugar ABC transporter substrate-binding protein [Rhizobiaceae bacterium]